MNPLKLLILTSVLGLALTGCGGPRKYVLQGTGSVVGADARITANFDAESAATRLDIEATNLAPPARVAADTDQYVVWQRSAPGGGWTRVGSLDYDESTRKGSLKSVSVPATDFDLQVTAESGAAGQSPSSEPVFAQRISR